MDCVGSEASKPTVSSRRARCSSSICKETEPSSKVRRRLCPWSRHPEPRCGHRAYEMLAMASCETYTRTCIHAAAATRHFRSSSPQARPALRRLQFVSKQEVAREAARCAAASSQAGRPEKAPLDSSTSSRMAQKSGDSSRYRRGPAAPNSRRACAAAPRVFENGSQHVGYMPQACSIAECRWQV